MFFFNQIGKSIKCPRWILVKNEIQNRKIANLMNFSHASIQSGKERFHCELVISWEMYFGSTNGAMLCRNPVRL